MKPLFLLFLCACLAMAQAPTKAATPQKKAPATAPKTGTGAPAASTSRLMNPAALTAKAPEVYRAKFTTTKGDFVVEVTRAWAPLGADRFYNLVRNHFYDNASLFRVVPGFVVQFGIPASAAVAKVWERAVIKDDPVKQSNKKGTIVFATAGPNTRTTQVFINLGENGRLDADGFAPFGTITEGTDVILNFFSGYRDNPTERQGEMTNLGKAYVEKNFPNLDSIKTATIIFPEAPPPAAKKAAPTATKAPATSPSKAPAPPAKKQ